MSDLSLVSLNDLLDEVLGRVDHGVVALMQVGEHTPNTITRIRRWKGNANTCAGLGLDVAHSALEGLRAEEQPREGSGG